MAFRIKKEQAICIKKEQAICIKKEQAICIKKERATALGQNDPPATILRESCSTRRKYKQAQCDTFIEWRNTQEHLSAMRYPFLPA